MRISSDALHAVTATAPARWGELDGIPDQIEHEPVELRGVGDDGPDPGLDVGHEFDALAPSGRHHRRTTRLDQRTELERRGSHRKAPASIRPIVKRSSTSVRSRRAF